MQQIDVLVNNITIKVNEQKIEVPNFLYGGTTYIPLRAVSEKLGLKVAWDDSTRTAYIGKRYNVFERDPSLKLFNGFFTNVNYDLPKEEFLRPGPQTKSEHAEKIAVRFNDNKDLTTIKEIYHWMRKNLAGYSQDDINKFSRTVNDILESGVLTGCTDYGLIFSTFTRLKGIPTVLINSAHTEWIKDLQMNLSGQNAVRGHAFVEIYISGKWILVDSTTGVVYLDYDPNNFSLPLNYYVFSKSVEVWDAGIRHESHNSAVQKYLFRDFDLTKYSFPQYKQTLNLASGLNPSEIESSQANNNTIHVAVCGDKEIAENVSDYVVLPPHLFRKKLVSVHSMSAKSAYNYLKSGGPYKAVLITYVAGSKDNLPLEFAHYLNVDRDQLDLESQSNIVRKQVEIDNTRILIVAGVNHLEIEKDIALNTVDELFAGF
jgi:hypothetical protein